MNIAWTHLKSIAETIVDECSSTTQLQNALDEMVTLCRQGCDLSPSLSFSARSGDTELPQGVAINPEAAAQCVKDYQRSVMFIRGFHAAIRQKLEEQPDKPIDVLYAGCGPYATIVLPVLTLIDPARLSLYLLDIHEESLSCAAQLVDFFQFDSLSTVYLCENACDYQHSTGFDLILAETMQKALEQEPQFKVTANLCHQLKPNGLFLPEQISISLYLHEIQNPNAVHFRQTILELTAESVLEDSLKPVEKDDESLVELSSFTIPTEYQHELFEFVFSTTIKIYGSHRLKDEEAEITLLTKVLDLEDAKPGETWQAFYQLGTYPRFAFKLLTNYSS
jgi:hypothetical protein